MKNSPAKDFEGLIVWQQAHQLVLSVYRYSNRFPTSEKYGLSTQMKRSAVSVPANIAEGFKKRSRLEKSRYYNIAQGSLEECRYYMILTRDLGYGDPGQLMDQINAVRKLLGAYVQKLRNS